MSGLFFFVANLTQPSSAPAPLSLQPMKRFLFNCQ